jgi:glycosyltransferase involved in cell wall biosynthesis
LNTQVSVIVPTRNRSALMATTLRSVLRQQGVDFEVIVVDDGSTDDTPAVLAALADERIRVVRHDRPSGVATARNDGAAHAHGEWLAFLDDDDLWAPDKLVAQLRAACSKGTDWAYSGAVVIDSHCRVLRVQRPLPPDDVVAALLHYDAIPGGGSNVILRRDTWQQIGPFDTRLRNTEDWEMWIRLAKHAPPACASGPLIARRLHTSNSTLDIAEIVRGTHMIEAMHHTQADWGRLHRWMAHSCLRGGQHRAAVGQFARAALLGHGVAVASDLGAVLRERLIGGPPAAHGALSTDAWAAPATEWLQEFQT